MKSTGCFIVLFLFFFSIQSCHSDKSGDKDASKADRHSLMFIKNGMVNGLFEIKASGHHITSTDSMLPADSVIVDSLSKSSGELFDHRYVALMVRIHRTDSLLFTLVAAGAKPDVKKFAAQTFPAVKKQLDSAKAVASSLK